MFRTGQLVLRHRDGGSIREDRIGDIVIPKRESHDFLVYAADLAAELRRIADTLDGAERTRRDGT